jgi:hypothetical protein
MAVIEVLITRQARVEYMQLSPAFTTVSSELSTSGFLVHGIAVL